ncbi:MAG: hypothetical protein IPL61_02680 [Myxococcales bacterium]|nr:hypothetical protein [Myxococcales bacterium]
MARWSILACAILAVACSDADPADVAGTYTIALTNRDNGCAIANWTVGPVAGTVTLVVTQSGSSASGDVQGLAGTALDVLVGGHVFTGAVDSAGVDLTIVGTRANSQGACAYTIDAEMTADLTIDNLAGSVIYRARTNGAADCGALTGCQSQQDFAGARPPR